MWTPKRALFPPTSLRDAALFPAVLLLIVLANVLLLVMLTAMLIVALVLFSLAAALGLRARRSRAGGY